jgi:dihydroxy-acid dehydratase
MHIVCEALGMALPGSAPVAALSAKMMDDVRAAGERIVQMVWDDVKPRDILQPGAFANAVRCVLAIGGSLNTVKHLQAVATEGECGVDVYDLFETLGNQTPVVAGVRPIGQHTIEEFEAAGGCRSLMKQLEPLLAGSVATVSGGSVADNLRGFTVADPEVIRPIDRPVAERPAIVLLRGNLAPESGLTKTGIVERKQRSFTGPAICFWTTDEAIAAIKDGRVQPGQVLVMRGAGVCGGPAMGGGASRVVFAVDGAGLGDKIAILTDGHLSGLVCKGLVVAELSPEAATGGPLALVQDGDSITIDLDSRRVDADLTEEQWQTRRAGWRAPAPAQDVGWLQQYRRNVGALSEGAVLVRHPAKAG